MTRQSPHCPLRELPVTSDRYGHLFPTARDALAESLEVALCNAADLAEKDDLRSKTRSRTVGDAVWGLRK